MVLGLSPYFSGWGGCDDVTAVGVMMSLSRVVDNSSSVDVVRNS